MAKDPPAESWFACAGGKSKAANSRARPVTILNLKCAKYILAATFISKDMNREMPVCNQDGTYIKKVQLSKKGLGKIEVIYPAPLGHVLVHADDSPFIYDLATRKVLAEMTLPEGSRVKQVHWTASFSHFDVITQNSHMMIGKNFELINSHKKTAKVKAGCFDEAADTAFNYLSLIHI